MFEKIRGFFMNILNCFRTDKIEDLIGVDINLSSKMYERITLWADMMSGDAPWNAEAKPCGILPQIAGRLNYFVTREIGLDVENEAIKKPMEHLNHNVGKIVEYITFTGAG